MKPFRPPGRGPLDDAGFASLLTAVAIAIGLIASGASQATSSASGTRLAANGAVLPVVRPASEPAAPIIDPVAGPVASRPTAARLPRVEVSARRV